jgi:outer membrane protein OmpA-like peptidoglycan-associated protein
VIYFPFDQYVITPEAQSVLQDAAKYATDGHASKETIVGYTDTSGSVAYNLRLSERRAKATADGLVALGVPQASLDVSWKSRPATASRNPSIAGRPSTSTSRRGRRATDHQGKARPKGRAFSVEVY